MRPKTVWAVYCSNVQQNDIFRIIAYGSRTLTTPEKKIPLSFRQAGIPCSEVGNLRAFTDFLNYASSFVLFTDNNSLTYVLSTA